MSDIVESVMSMVEDIADSAFMEGYQAGREDAEVVGEDTDFVADPEVTAELDNIEDGCTDCDAVLNTDYINGFMDGHESAQGFEVREVREEVTGNEGMTLSRVEVTYVDGQTDMAPLYLENDLLGRQTQLDRILDQLNDGGFVRIASIIVRADTVEAVRVLR